MAFINAANYKNVNQSIIYSTSGSHMATNSRRLSILFNKKTPKKNIPTNSSYSLLNCILTTCLWPGTALLLNKLCAPFKAND